MSNLFKTLEYEAFRAGITPRTNQSREWFRKKTQALRRVSRNDIMKEDPIELKQRGALGTMNMFFYEAKHKETLPYWDAFPLVIAIGPAAGGFLGLNLHYLPPVLRAKFLDALLDTLNNSAYNNSTKFTVTYNMLKKAANMKYFKPCVKHYLYNQVRSRFARVPAPEWEIATFLPLADWRKTSASNVYSDSRGMI